MIVDANSPPCEHKSVTPMWDADAVAGLDSAAIRAKFPRFYGVCPDCGERVIVYASLEQYIAGDY